MSDFEVYRRTLLNNVRDAADSGMKIVLYNEYNELLSVVSKVSQEAKTKEELALLRKIHDVLEKRRDSVIG